MKVLEVIIAVQIGLIDLGIQTYAEGGNIWAFSKVDDNTVEAMVSNKEGTWKVKIAEKDCMRGVVTLYEVNIVDEIAGLEIWNEPVAFKGGGLAVAVQPSEDYKATNELFQSILTKTKSSNLVEKDASMSRFKESLGLGWD